MLARLRNVVLWQYPPDTPIEKLHKHYRIARTVACIWTTLTVLMAAALFDFMFSKGWWQQLALIVGMVASFISLLGSLPAIGCYFWAEEIEKTLKARGYPIPADRPIGRQVGAAALKAVYWFAALLIGAHLFIKPPS